MSDNVNHELRQRLAAPFAADEIQWKPAAVSGSRALAICYVSARAVMDRLDDCFGVGGWQTSYRETPDGVNCRLELWIGERWIQHEDFGAFSEQPDGGDKVKAGYSDSLKRVAIHVGVGRYLYAVPNQWLPWDPKARKFLQEPKLPQQAGGNGKLIRKSSAAAATPPGANHTPGNGITDEERQELTQLLAQKGKTAGAALKTAGCHGASLKDLTREQYQLLVEKLTQLPDVPKLPGYVKFPKEPS
jgi:hypothetical protein